MKKIKTLLLFILLSNIAFSTNPIANLNKKNVSEYYLINNGDGCYTLMINLKKPITNKNKIKKMIFDNPLLLSEWNIEYIVEHTVVICKLTPINKVKNLCSNI
jgi:hypothetical protein